MLQKYNRDKIIELFLDNPIEEFQLREISRKTGISLPSVKNYLKELEQEKVIYKQIPKTTYPQYLLNYDNSYVKHLKKIHIQEKLFPIIQAIDDDIQPECIILFGSAAKGEDTKESDIDLFIQSKEKPKMLRKFERKLNKKIHIINEEEFSYLSEELKTSILNGILLKGYVRPWD